MRPLSEQTDTGNSATGVGSKKLVFELRVSDRNKKSELIGTSEIEMFVVEIVKIDDTRF